MTKKKSDTEVTKAKENTTSLRLRPGVTGFVLATSTKQVSEFLSDNGASIDCGTVRAIVVPVNPSYEVPIYYPWETGPARSFTMSRTAFKAVVYTHSDGRTVDYGPNSYPALPVQFIETEAAGDTKVKSGFVLMKDRDKAGGNDREKLFKFSFLPKSTDFLPFSLKDTCEDDSRCSTNFIKSEFLEAFKESEKKNDTIEAIANSFRTCRASVKIELELQASAGTPGFLGWVLGPVVKAGAKATQTITLPAGKVYRMYDLEHVIPGEETEGKLYKELVCDNGRPFMANIVELPLDSTTSTVILDQEVVLGIIDDHFLRPEFRQHRRRDAMFVVPYENVVGESYFASFRRLSLFLEGELFSPESKVKSDDRERVISFLIENLADWYGPRDTLPSD